MINYKIEYSMIEPMVGIELYFYEENEYLYDLYSKLVNVQALISGITKVYEDNRRVDYDSFRLPTFNDNEIVNNRKDNLRYMLNKNFNEDDVYKIEQILDTVGYREIKVASKGLSNTNAYPTTSDKFCSKYKDLVVLNKFEQGSLFLDILSTLLGGLILKFAETLIFKDNKNTINVKIENNILVILEGNKPKKIVRLCDENKSTFETASKNSLYLNDYYNKILSEIDINPDNVEKSVENLLKKLAEEELFSSYVTYDQRGIKTVAKDTKRILNRRV